MPKSHCQACVEADTEKMVSCCQCNTWWHYECADVNDSIAGEDRTFYCSLCQRPSPSIPMDSVQHQTDSCSRAGSKTGSDMGRSSCGSKAKWAQFKLDRLAAMKEIAFKRLDLARREQEQQHEHLRLQVEQEIFEETFRLREEIELDDDDDGRRSTTTEQSSRSKVVRWQKQQHNAIDATTDTSTPRDNADHPIVNKGSTVAETHTGQGGKQTPPVNKQRVLQRALAGISLNDSAIGPTLRSILDQSGSAKAPVGNSSQIVSALTTLPCKSNTNRPILSATGNLNSNTQNKLNIPSTFVNEPRVNSLLSELSKMCSGIPTAATDIFRDRISERSGNLDRHDANLPVAGSTSGALPTSLPQWTQDGAEDAAPEQPWEGPTPRQIAARHVMAKELPTFTGRAEEWPMFISSFVNTTQACGYSNAKNLSRLQKCLKGNALTHVQSLLLHPEGVPHVLTQLEQLYGRPELLIHTLLQKIREVQSPKDGDPESLVAFGLMMQNLCNHMIAARQEAHINNPELLHTLISKLPVNWRMDWSLYQERCTVVNIQTFSQYMQVLVRAGLNASLYSDQKTNHQRIKDKGIKCKDFCGAHTTEESPKSPEKEIVEKQSSSSRPTCLVCNNPEHRVKHCPDFAKLELEERWKLIQRFGLCRSCLGAHGRRPCQIRKYCDVDGCQRRHHKLLHDQKFHSGAKPNSNSDKRTPKQDSNANKKEVTRNLTDKGNSSNAVTNHHSAGQAALFRIIPVTLYGNNRSVLAYAFLDDGSSRTLVDEAIVKQLGVSGETQPLCLQWTANMKRTESDSQRITLEIAGCANESKYKLTDVRTVTKLDLPKQSLRYKEMVKAYPYLKGLPVEDYDKATPCILIGNDNAHVTATLKMRDGQPGEPIAAKSRLGWTVYGFNQDSSVGRAHRFHICECKKQDQSVHELVEKFFAVESLGIMEVSCPESADVQRANQILQGTIRRVGQRFEIGLLWRFDHFEFPDSYPMAVRRLQCLERRIQSDPVIGESVKRQMVEYQEKGYIHKATEAELQEADMRRAWYLPLGIVLNPKKPNKVRIFRDAAAKVDGVSLNTMLMKGPDLLNTLLGVLYGFREKRIAFSADLKEMFHQILVRKEDRHAQRLLWREDSTQAPEVFVMNVVTFGAACSPCLAQYVKNKNAQEHAYKYPAASDAIIRKHYVDDYLDSADDVEEAVKLALEVKYVHKRGGFELRNWLSNSKEVLARVGENDPSKEKCLQLDIGEAAERVLGMFWKPEQDIITYSTELAVATERPTKRQALRVVMSPFDPAGLLCYFLIHGKILIQELWRAKTEWDELIPENLCERWWRWTDLFRYLDKIKIPRCYFPARSTQEIVTLQLHIFVDASEEAYACVGYLRAIFPGSIEVALVGGKSKVAPLKAHSIPRLELMAAVIGVRLMKIVLKSHSLRIERTVLWSDSKTVLAWINSDHRNYRQFVACRVGEILCKSQAEQWRWVPTKENIADEATKWGKGPCMSPTGRWFLGPEFLHLTEGEWPVSVQSTDAKTGHSKWNRLNRAVAYMLRIIRLMREKKGKRTTRELERVKAILQGKQWSLLQFDPLEQEEMQLAETTIFRWVQREQYPDESVTLFHNRGEQNRRQVKLERTSPIRKASPFMDECGIIRSDGRIAAATCVTFSTKFPIILPKQHWVTYLICDWYHQKHYHANRETIVNEMRQRFHISELRALVRMCAKKCQVCKVKNPIAAVPREAPLPAARLQAYVRPFSYVGVDYFGPLEVRVNRSHVKRWVALFTCMTVRAIHLEVVHTLSTESFKMALRRFISARGAPVEIRSDQGTNFVGANNELRRKLKNINEQLCETFTNVETKWIFNPPGAPHMGGAWERLVRSVKCALAAMDTTRKPNEETLATLVKEVESLINSRPLTYIPLEVGEQEALTPNHFLLLSSSGVVQTPKSLTDMKQASRSEWNKCQVMIDQFWRRWVREYLPTIARRTKWFEETKPIEVGDLVVALEEKVRNGWMRGRVVKIIKGRDGRVRTAVIQTSNNTFMERPVAKLARLDIGVGGKADPEA
ncbi:uncharacterized protein LOC129728499 [Wyeomyia smithii]|uniref:uncharacterized protein LOC129728499 n=1 Tax=Wyeomyia smithii TaxID=174621 RepID=UPI002467BD39|nr:uncharacterized protein LOC129728499 [Wyeomyia smithii]